MPRTYRSRSTGIGSTNTREMSGPSAGSTYGCGQRDDQIGFAELPAARPSGTPVEGRGGCLRARHPRPSVE